ncbi:MAG: hypothetical protein F6K30_11550 [Cyanothece sp. SIO2G6]|nr:hypothetical protein [Cyanothece sp. SIO2G6]
MALTPAHPNAQPVPSQDLQTLSDPQHQPSPPSKSVRWRSLLVKTTFWLSTEIILGVMGLDQLADYSEFMLQRHLLAQVTESVVHIISSL